MLTKLTCRGRDFTTAVERARRAIAEFRIRGVATNIPFLAARPRRPRLPPRRRHHVVHRRPPPAADRTLQRRPRHQAARLPRRRHRQPAARRLAGRPRRGSQAAARSSAGEPPAGSRQRLPGARPGRVRPPPARAERRRRHRHHLPRRPPVAAGHPGAHHRPRGRRRPRRPADAAAALGRGLGRGDLRRRAALPRRGPVGAAGAAAQGHPEHLPADAAARPQHGRLHAVPHGGHRGLRARGGGHRHRHLPHLRRPQRRRADAAGHRGRARHRHRRRRGRALLHRRPVRPRRAALHARLLPAAWPSASSRPAPTSSRSRTWPGLLRPPAARRLVDRAARPLRPAGPPAHPRHRGRPARHPAGRDRRRRRRRRRRLRADGRHHQPAVAVGAGRRHRPHRARDRAVADARSATSSPTGRRPAGLYAPFESGLPVADRARLHPRDPRRPALQPAPAGDRARAGREVRADRGHVRRRQRHPRQHRQGHAVLARSSATWPCTWSASAPTRHEFAEDPRKFDVPDSVIGFLSGELGDPPGGWPEPFRTKALAGRADPAGRHRARPTTSAAGWPRTAARRSTRCSSPGPRRSSPSRARSTATSRRSPTVDFLYGLRRGPGAPGPARGGQDAAARARGRQRGRRARHPHGHVHHQRPAAPGQRPRPLGRGRRPDRGEGRPVQARPRRGAVRRRGHASGRGGRDGRGRATPSRPSRR